MDGASKVVVAGLGDLGGRVLELLAAEPGVGELTGWGRRREASAGLVQQAALVADALGGAEHVAHLAVDLRDQESVRLALDSVRPDVVVLAASRHSWWRTPAAARGVPYGVWLPLQLSLLRVLARAVRDSDASPVVVSLVHPDATGPLLATEGLAPDVGAGNVAEVAAKLRVLAAEEHGCPRAEVDVRLVLHHAVERLAFSVFEPPADSTASDEEAPPYLAEVRVRGRRLSEDQVDRLLRRPYALPAGTGSHHLTAATTARLVRALLGDEPQQLHVPSPRGLPGGYPVVVSRGEVELDLPDGVRLEEAVAVNERAGRHDGVAAVTESGDLVLTEAASAAATEVLGLSMPRVGLDDLDEVADVLEGALARLRRLEAAGAATGPERPTAASTG